MPQAICLSLPSSWRSIIRRCTEDQEFDFFTYKFWATVVYVKTPINRINNICGILFLYICDYICAASSSQIHAPRAFNIF